MRKVIMVGTFNKKRNIPRFIYFCCWEFIYFI